MNLSHSMFNFLKITNPMYHVFPPKTSVVSFLKMMKSLPHTHVFLMLTFAGSYTSLLSKQRYIDSRLHEKIPLLIVDVRNSPAVVHQLQQSFPSLFKRNKLPLHICFEKKYNDDTHRLELKPLFMNSAILWDRHFDELQNVLVDKKPLAKML